MSPHNTKPSSLTQFLAEMRRRHVGRFSIGYAAAAFVLLQLAEIVFPAFGLHDIWLRVLVVAVVLAFLPAVVLAWVFDLTSEGLRRTEELPRSSSDLGRGSLNARVALVVVSFLTVGGLGVWVMGTSALSPTVNPEGPISDIALTEYDPAQPVTSVAVLALDDLTEGGGQAYFTTGMQEELIAQLSMVSGLRVASRTSAARYAGTPTQIPAIGRELGVDAIIEGSVRRDLTNDSVRITVQLIHAASDTHIWTGQYNRHFTDVLNLQSEVAVEIVRAVQGEITPEDETRMRYAADKSVAPEALDAYLRGNEAYDQGTPEGYRAAMGLYGQAVEADSGFAPAVAGLAGSRFLVTMDGPEVVEGELERAREEARRALELDPTSSMVREVFTLIDGNISEVMPSQTVVEAHGAMDTPQTRVISIPGTSDSIVINLQGMDSTWMGAVSRIGKALEMRVIQRGEFEGDAEGRARQFMAARRLLSDGQFDGASQVLEEMLDDEPAFAPGWEMLVKSEVGTGDIEDLVAAIVGWSEAGGPGAPDEASVDDLEDAVAADGMRGYWAWTLDRLEAQASLGAPVSAVERATAHAALGHKEEALAYLAEGLRSRDRQLLTLQADPVWDSFRRLPEFQAIAREARLMRSAPTRRGPGGGN